MHNCDLSWNLISENVDRTYRSFQWTTPEEENIFKFLNSYTTPALKILTHDCLIRSEKFNKGFLTWISYGRVFVTSATCRRGFKGLLLILNIQISSCYLDMLIQHERDTCTRRKGEGVYLKEELQIFWYRHSTKYVLLLIVKSLKSPLISSFLSQSYTHTLQLLQPFN